MLCIAQFACAMTSQTRIDYAAALDRASAVYKEAETRADTRGVTREVREKAALAKCDAMQTVAKNTCVTAAKAAHAQ